MKVLAMFEDEMLDILKKSGLVASSKGVYRVEFEERNEDEISSGLKGVYMVTYFKGADGAPLGWFECWIGNMGYAKFMDVFRKSLNKKKTPF